jgi:hypothetical protein
VHSKKEVRKALGYAEELNFKVEETPAGHKWGRVICGEPGCSERPLSVWSTPADEFIHGKQIRRWVNKHKATHEDAQGEQ